MRAIEAGLVSLENVMNFVDPNIATTASFQSLLVETPADASATATTAATQAVQQTLGLHASLQIYEAVEIE